MDLSGTHGKRLNRKYRFYENRERTVYFPRNGRRDESPPYAHPFASQVPRATGRNGTGCDLSTDRLHQLGLRYTANDALQHWKDRKQKTDSESYALWTALKTCSPEDSIRIKQTWDSLRVETQAFNYAFMKEHINQTVGKFLYKMIKTSLTEELRKELDEANH